MDGLCWLDGEQRVRLAQTRAKCGSWRAELSLRASKAVMYTGHIDLESTGRGGEGEDGVAEMCWWGAIAKPSGRPGHTGLLGTFLSDAVVARVIGLLTTAHRAAALDHRAVIRPAAIASRSAASRRSCSSLRCSALCSWGARAIVCMYLQLSARLRLQSAHQPEKPPAPSADIQDCLSIV